MRRSRRAIVVGGSALLWAFVYGSSLLMAEMRDLGYSDWCTSQHHPHCPPEPGTSIWFVVMLALGALGAVVGLVWIARPSQTSN